MVPPRTATTRSEEETVQLGAALGRSLERDAVVLLFGELGAGKTAFVRGLAAGLGADPSDVTSPTFTLTQQYRGRITLYHVDLYRLESRDVDDLGLEELSEEGGVIAIEWAEKLPRPMPGAIEVHIVDRGGDTREVTLTIPPGNSAPPS